jgi:hypothetical protein
MTIDDDVDEPLPLATEFYIEREPFENEPYPKMGAMAAANDCGETRFYIYDTNPFAPYPGLRNHIYGMLTAEMAQQRCLPDEQQLGDRKRGSYTLAMTFVSATLEAVSEDMRAAHEYLTGALYAIRAMLGDDSPGGGSASPLDN